MSDLSLLPAPGAKAAKVCGILSIVFALTCVGLPVALILGIVALVQQAKAKRLAKADPEGYAPVPSTGLVTGIIGLVLAALMLPVMGMAAAFAVPSVMLYREQVRNTAVQHHLDRAKAKAEAAVLEWQARNPGQPVPQEALIRDLLRDPELAALRNPFDPQSPAFLGGETGPGGAVMIHPDRSEEGGVTTWSVKFRAEIPRRNEQRVLTAEVITHTQEQVQGRTEDGWEVVNPPAAQN
ncbi:DUF4190 domain-containing protein [Geothrix sp. SG200]|uniref:DUF4190 domain-containing protein n=1 Tax=Geothrix sp. SG200 TaxID=2922865 RepID=UPI001FADB6FA|nr:DUF4190 domain-containing protein [Geothrix sp. SG200]